MVARWKKWLDEYPDFRRWYENNCRGSEYTGREYARTLYRLMNILDFTPASILEVDRSDTDNLKDLLMDFVTEQMKDTDGKPKSVTYMESYIKILNSWLTHKNRQPILGIKLGNKNHRPTLENERVPLKNELRQLFHYAMTRGRVSIALIAFSGLRPQVLGNRTGIDGLKLKDMPDVRIDHGQVVYDEMPIRINVRSELSKNKLKYMTFLGPEGCEYLKSYLEMRLAGGEELTPESPVITYKEGYIQTGYDPDQNRLSKHITTKTLTKEIREAIRSKYDWRPYIFKSYFSTQLLVAENHGIISHAYRQHFMGHKGDIEAVYSTNKGILPDHVIDDMRKTYSNCLEYIETIEKSTNEDAIKDEFTKQLLLVAGYTPEEIETIDLDQGDADFQETVRKKLLGSMVNNGNRQRVVKIADIEEFIEKGWEYVAKITDEKVIMKLP